MGSQVKRYSKMQSFAIAGVIVLLAGCGGDGTSSAAGNSSTGPASQPIAQVACNQIPAQVSVNGAQVNAATLVAAGQYTPPGSTTSYTVPAFCRVAGVATPSSDSAIQFEVWIPAGAAWNGKLEVVGNGGYAGAIGYADMAQALARGYAAAGGDSGHEGPDSDLSFVIGHPEKMADWGYRSVHAVIAAAKPLVAAAQGANPVRSYYYGCSTGGGQGLAEAQRYPTDFDGIIAGAPGNNRTRLNMYFLWMYAKNHPNGAEVIPASKLPVISAAAVSACDTQRGTSDGFYDSSQCTFDPSKLLCTGADSASCLTAPQVATVQAIYAGPVDPNTGARIFSGGNPSAESGWTGYVNAVEPARTDFWRYWVFNNPNWTWQSFDYDRDVTYTDALVGPVVNNNNPDLSAFKAHGGKLIIYHGESDPIAPVGDTLSYYNNVLALQGSQQQMDSFYRLFLAPGMGHCSGGAGPNVFGNEGTTPLQINAQHDVTTAMDQWVTKGIPPSSIVASNIANNVVTRSRPLCPYPHVARYVGGGDRNNAASWACQ